LLFLDSSELYYQRPTKDPWFSATTVVHPRNGTLFYYEADQPVGILGCATQTRICNPKISTGDQCFDGSTFRFVGNETREALIRLWPNDKERSEIRAFFTALNRMGDGTGAVFYSLPSIPTFISRNSVLGNIQTETLPEDRWQAELEQIFRASLATVQHMLVEHARGMWLGYDGACYADNVCSRLCHSQVSTRVLIVPQH
jgi:hypothetical protein